MTTNSITSTQTTSKVFSFLREFGIAVGLFVLWQYCVWLKGRHTPIGAISRGRAIWHLEQWLHIPSEQWLQSMSKPLWTVANTYYDFAHVFVMLAFIIYIVLCHREQWRYFRNVMFSTTFLGLAIQFAMSSAPPRFIGIPHLVDTANVSGMSIYKAAGSAVDQYSTFPSLHVAWAAIIALCAYRITKSRMKYFWFMHLPATIFVVVVTGNHFWLDCIFGIAITVIPICYFKPFTQIP